MTSRAMRTFWLTVGLCYATAAAGDAALHLQEVHTAGVPRFAPAHLAVAFSACLFWPVDLIARQLLAH